MPSTRHRSAMTITTTTRSLFAGLWGRLRRHGARRAVDLALLELALADQLDEQWLALHHLEAAEHRLGDHLAARVVALLHGADNAPVPMRSLALDDDLLAEAGPIALALLDMYATATAPRRRAHLVLALNEVFGPVFDDHGVNPSVLTDVAIAFFRQGGFTDQAISDELNRHATATTTGGVA